MTNRAVIFDMDGLLLDTEVVSRWAWGEALSEHGVVLTEVLYAQFVGRDLRSRAEILRSEFGEDFPFEKVKARRIFLGDKREEEEGLIVKPGARELLEKLYQKQVPIALATGTDSKRTIARLERAHLRDYFCVIVTMDDVLEGKPAPDIFLEAASQLRVSPAHCVVIEDSSAGAVAGARAGMKVYLVPDLEEPAIEARQAAARISASLVDLIQELPSEFSNSTNIDF